MMSKKLTNIELRSEEVKDIIEAIPHWMIRYGNVFIFGLIILLLFMSWFIKYPDTIVSQAQITTKLPPQKSYVQITGKLDSIFVRDNQFIDKGDILSVLENTANFEHIQLLRSIVDTIKPNTENFLFPFDELPILFLGEVESEYAIFENSYIQYQLNKELKPFLNELKGNQMSKSQLHMRLNTLTSQKKINQSELNVLKKDLDRQQQLFNKGVIAKQSLESKELSYLQAQRSYANIDAAISQIREAISNTNIQSISTSINQTKEEINLLKNVIQSFNQLKSALINWEKSYTIVSDIDGKVVFSELWTKNQNVYQNQLMFTIIPKENSAFIAKLKTPAQNSGKIKVGQTVNIKLESYPDNQFGIVQGQVESMALLPDENGFYLVQVSLSSELVTSYNKKIVFKHEMKGNAEIITEDLRLFERFFYQLKQALDR